VTWFSAENTKTSELGGSGVNVFEPIGVTPADTQAVRSTAKIGMKPALRRKHMTPKLVSFV
jgi:hypothetical protein